LGVATGGKTREGWGTDAFGKKGKDNWREKGRVKSCQRKSCAFDKGREGGWKEEEEKPKRINSFTTSRKFGEGVLWGKKYKKEKDS